MPLKQIKKRKDLPTLINNHNLTGKGVEIGVKMGLFSNHLLKNTKLSKIYSIDIWQKLPNNEYRDLSNLPNFIQNLFLSITRQILKKHKNRSKIIIANSSDAVNKFEIESLDFVYIDANHSYEHTKEDINLWYGKLKKGGILSGHDYINKKGLFSNYGVKKAVDEFASTHAKNVKITKEKWPSWYLIK